MDEYKRLERKLEHKGRIVDFYTDTIQLPDGRTAQWDYIHHRGAAAIVPVMSNGDILMVRQYRNAPERYTLEIPAGGLNIGEENDREGAAMRELEEETGYKTNHAEHLLDLYTTIAFCSEVISIYYTNELIPSKQHMDEDEFIHVERHSLDSLVEKILTGEIQDSKTIAGIFAYKSIIEKQSER